MTSLATAPAVSTTNRVSTGITRMVANIASRIDKGLTTADKVEAMRVEMDMDTQEFCSFQSLKSAAAGSLLTFAEAQTIYGYLGKTPDHFARQSAAVKVVLTRIFAELLDRRIDQIGGVR